MHFVIINTSSVNVQLVDFVWSSFRRGGGGYSGKYGLLLMYK